MTGINDLPVEVLGHIFKLAAKNERRTSSRIDPREYLQFWGGQYHRTCPPFVFLSVCGHWRAVAEAIPLLWTPLDATMHTLRTGRLMPPEALEHWLSLSRSIPLEFFLLQGSSRKDDTRTKVLAAHAATMLRVLATQSHRWRSAAFELDFRLAGVFADILLNHFNPESLPNLKRLEIVAFYDKRGTIPVADLGRAIGGIKSLEELYLVLGRDDEMPSLLRDIPWSQLTTIYLDVYLTVHQVALFLSQATAAVTATFKCVDGTPVLHSDTHRSTLSQLKSLTMNGDESSFSLLDLFDFPVLEQLNIMSYLIPFYEPLQQLMERSTCHIRQIALHVNGPLSGSELEKYLHIPGLREVPHVEFDNNDILKIAPAVVAQLGDDNPVLWSWRSLRRVACIGWKAQFDCTDGPVTRITPTSNIV